MGKPLPDDASAPFPSRHCDPFGVRILYAEKNRRGGVGESYWEMMDRNAENPGQMVCVKERTMKQPKSRRAL
jgi:hypothetical protein